MLRSIESLLLIPSVTFGLVPAEIFPWALFYMFIKSYQIRYLYTSIFILFSIYFFANITLSENFIFIKALASLVSYLNSVGILLFIAKYASEKNIALIYDAFKFFFYFLFLLAVIQYLSIIEFLNEYWNFFVPRGSMSKLDGSRGIMGLSTEPSRFAYEIICYIVVFYATRYNCRSTILVIGLIFILLCSSLTGIFLIGLLFLFLFPMRSLIIVLCSLCLYSIFDFSLPDRLYFLELLINMNFEESINEVINQAYHRIPVIISSVHAAFAAPFGYGLGNWELSQLSNDTKYNILGGVIGSDFINRPTFIFSLLVELGLVPTFVIIYFIFYFIEFNRLSIFLLIVCFFVSDPGNPIPFLSLGILTIYYKRNKLNFLMFDKVQHVHKQI